MHWHKLDEEMVKASKYRHNYINKQVITEFGRAEFRYMHYNNPESRFVIKKWDETDRREKLDQIQYAL